MMRRRAHLPSQHRHDGEKINRNSRELRKRSAEFCASSVRRSHCPSTQISRFHLCRAEVVEFAHESRVFCSNNLILYYWPVNIKEKSQYRALNATAYRNGLKQIGEEDRQSLPESNNAPSKLKRWEV